MTELREEFDRCWQWLEASNEYAAFRHNGKVWLTHTKEDIWERVASKKAFLWPGEAAAFLTDFNRSPTGLLSHYNWMAGGDLQEIKELVKKCEDWGRQQGAHRQIGNGRRGWLREFDGYREIGVRKEKSLLE